MAVQLNHTIVPARDGEAAARWLADLLGVGEPVRFSVFWQVSLSNGVDLDFDTHGHDGGRGVYFANPDGHLLEIITVPYGGWPA